MALSNTVKKRLIDARLNNRILRKKPLLLLRHKQHLQWAKDHRNWTEDMWKEVVWSDESKINLFHSDAWLNVYTTSVCEADE